MTDKTTWTIGNDPACDLVVNRPSVSWRHCRLTRSADGSFALEDLGSTNGTFVNGRRVTGVIAVERRDAVMLGLSVPMPWPPEPSVPVSGGKSFRVGRDRDNDIVIDSGEVSAHHARVVLTSGGVEAFVEDLGSTNGTSVGHPGGKVARASFTRDDVVYFGPVAVRGSQFFEERTETFPILEMRGAVLTIGRDPGCDRVIDLPMVSSRHARIARAGASLVIEDLGSANGTFVNGRRIMQPQPVAPGDLVGLGSSLFRLVDGAGGLVTRGGPITELLPTDPPPHASEPGSKPDPGDTTERHRIERPSPALALTLALGAQVLLIGLVIWIGSMGSLPATLFGLSVASVWVGLMVGVSDRLLAAWFRPEPSWETAVLGPVCRSALIDAVLVLGLLEFAAWRFPIGGGVLSVGGILWLVGLVGSALGRILVRVFEKYAVSLVVAAGLTLGMGWVGGPSRPLPRATAIERWGASALPTRWAFEALLMATSEGRRDHDGFDPVERFFPAETDRMGTSACVTALVAFWLGLVAAEVLIVLARRSRS